MMFTPKVTPVQHEGCSAHSPLKEEVDIKPVEFEVSSEEEKTD